MTNSRRALLCVPYRDTYFWNSFGFSVRDLQFLYVLKSLNYFQNISIVNRPVSIYEKITTKKRLSKPKGFEVYDYLSLDLIGPLKKRSWTEYCYKHLFKKAINELIDSNDYDEIIVLDFTPIAILPHVYHKKIKITYWYDLIDNFTKHNRFTIKEKELVEKKYTHVENHYHFITSVSSKAATAMDREDAYVITNGVFNEGEPIRKPTGNLAYDFGFVGFITDKFDTKFIQQLTTMGFTVVIYGKAYDKEVAKQLKSIGVELKGAFKHKDLPSIISTFKVGLIPYLQHKLHDESPLKMYEYLKNNTPCMTSVNYELSNKYIRNYSTTKDLTQDIIDLISFSGLDAISDSICPNDVLQNKISTFFNEKIK